MKRHKSHQIDSRAQKIFNYICPDYWSIQEPSEDYGIDYLIQVFDKETGESTKISFFIQLKGTTNYVENEMYVKFPIETRYLKYYYTKIDKPVFLIVVDVNTEDSCWLLVQKYINEELEIKNPTWKSQKTITLNIPKENNFSNPQIIEKYAEESSSYCNLLINGIPTYELTWEVKNILNNPEEKSKYIKQKYSKLFDAETKIAFELIHYANNPQESKKSFQSVYNKTKEDKDNVLAHLNSIIGLITYCNLQKEDEIKQLFEYIEEGFNLAKENEIKYLEYYFYGCNLEKSFFILQEELNRYMITQKIANNKKNILSNLIKINVQEKILNIHKNLNECYDKFSKNLIRPLKDKELFIFVELLSMLIRMRLYQTRSLYNFMEQDVIDSLLNQLKQLISVFKNIIEVSEDLTIFEYDLFTFKIMYGYLKKDDGFHDIIEEYKNYANDNNSKYHVEKAESLKKYLNEYSKEKKDISEMNDEEIHDLFKTLIMMIEGIDIDNDDSNLALALKIAVEDVNPKRILDNCKHLEIAYQGGGQYTQFFGLYSGGMKIIYCENGGIESGWLLNEIYKGFHEKYCKDCEYRTEQDFKWNPENISHIKSDKFKEILKKHPFFSR